MSLSRRTFVGLGAAALAAPALPRASLAAAPPAGRQMPGVHRLTVGELEVTALLDGYGDIPPEMFLSIDPAAAEALLDQAFLPSWPYRIPINAYLVNTGDRLVLIDSGSSTSMGPTAGRLLENLAAAGVDPAAIDAVALTHLHVDHVNGVLTPDGAVAFPNAELVVDETEWGFWTDPAALSSAPEPMRPFFQAAQNAVAPYANAGRVRRFTGEAEILPGLTAVALPGHTPGHTGLRLSSGDQQLLVWGDVVHAAALQLPRPDWGLVFDVDPAQAIATRQRALDMAAADRLLVAGMHLPFPGVGHVARAGSGYAFVPAQWRYEL